MVNEEKIFKKIDKIQEDILNLEKEIKKLTIRVEILETVKESKKHYFEQIKK